MDQRDIDGVRHVVLLALDPEESVGLGVARYAVTTPDVAEIAFAIGDELQGQGLGRTLVEALLEEGRSAGIERFTATTLADNAAALGLLRATGFGVVGRDGATVDLARAAA